ncbi:MAG: PKD domain-containing protein, partial [Bacteroidales bacterium]|nr:PKD domain-containing protein [Bacteroidales bacterium]
MKPSCKTFILFLLVTCLINHSSWGQTESYSVRLAPFSSNKYDEFSPVYYKNGIVFCSSWKNDVFITYSTPEKKELLNMYYVKLVNDSINLESLGILSKELMTNFNDGPATFNTDGNVIYYSRNNDVDYKIRDVFDPKNKLGIYSAELTNGIWTNIKPFKYNNLNYSITTPSLAPDGKRLYFASDMPGGFGGADLYYCEWNNNDWDEPVNLGSKVNTTGNEAYPFASKSGELYFSSDGHKGLGKKDIFFSKEVEGEWITPIHLDPPINSKEDDFGLVTDLNLEGGYFSSHRKKTDDIFSFKTEIHQFTNCDSLQENHYCFLFYDEGFPDVVDTLPLRYEWDFGDGGKVVGLEAEHCFPGPGKYSVQLNIIDNITGNTFFTQSSYEFELEDIEQPFINSTDASIVGNKIEFDGLKTNLPDFEIADYIWNFGDGYKAKGSVVGHTYQNKGEYIVQLGLLGKKDSLGVIPKTCVYKKINILEDYQAMAMHTAKAKGELAALLEIEQSDQSVVDNLYSYGYALQQNAVFRVEILNSDTQLSIDTSLFDPLRGEYNIKEVYLKG